MAHSKKVKTETAPFALSLQTGDLAVTSSGNTPEETLAALPRPTKMFLKGTLTITKDGKSRQRVLVVNQVKRLFYPLAQKVLAKQLFTGL